MDATDALPPASATEVVKLPARLVESLLATPGGPLGRIRESIAPFRFEIAGARNGVRIGGDGIARVLVGKILERLAGAIAEGGRADAAAVDATIRGAIDTCLRHDLAYRLEGLAHSVRPMSLNQVAFMQALLANERPLMIAVGPTGTGKTHLAIAAALNQLALERVRHVVITKPHVVMEGEIVTPATRGETEYDPQFNVFEDALRDLVGHHEFQRLVDEQRLEITPLGRMRGRTFNDSFVIVDEAQNMTVRKMRMAVTRLGRHARMVVMGDPAQVDLRGDELSGLAHLLRLVEGTDVASVHRFDTTQIIRNRLVARLEELYSRDGGEAAQIAA